MAQRRRRGRTRKNILSLATLLSMAWMVLTTAAAMCLKALGLIVRLFNTMRTTSSTASNAPRTVKTNRRPTAPSGRATAPARTAPTTKPAPLATQVAGAGRWIAPGKSIDVQGIVIAGGMLYAGTSLKTTTGAVDPCLVDPTLPIAFRSQAVRIDGYWPSYATLTPQARRTYLEWLAGGRQDPNIDIGYVFLYFYGLERRAILDAALDSAVMRDYPVIATELARLIALYASTSKSFKKYARQLLDWVTFTNEQQIYASGNLPQLGQSLMKIKFALGQAAVDSAPIPAKLMLAWVKNDPGTFALRTPASRCPSQFDAVFETHYREQYGSGMVLAPNRLRLTFVYTAASAGLGNSSNITMSFKDIPDVTASKKITAAIGEVVEKATQTIEPFSRYIARNPQAHNDFEGLILLPPYLWPNALRQVLHGFKRSVLKAPLSMTGAALLQALGVTNSLSKEKTQALAQSLGALSIGMEPDVATNPKVLRAEERIVLFDLPALPDETRNDASYQASLLTIQLAAAVATSDGDMGQDELRHLYKQIPAWTHLPLNHRKRLAAHLHIRRHHPIKLSALTKPLAALSCDEKNAVVAFMVALVQTDGRITAKEVAMMQKVYAALGLDASAFLEQHRAALRQPTPNTAAVATKRKPLPLNFERIAALQEDTAKVSALLQNIFAPQDDAVAPIENDAAPIASVQPKVQLDLTKIAALQEDTAQVDNLLAGIFVHEPTGDGPSPEPSIDMGLATSDDQAQEAAVAVAVPLIAGLDALHDRFARLLLTQHQWSREALQGAAFEMGLMLDGALERINDAAFDAYDAPFAEGDDPIEINIDIKHQLPS